MAAESPRAAFADPPDDLDADRDPVDVVRQRDPLTRERGEIDLQPVP